MNKRVKLQIFILILFLISATIFLAFSPTTISDSEISTGDLTFTGDLTYNGNNRTDTIAYPEETVDYVVFNSGSTFYAKNGATGQIDYNGSNYITTLQYAIDNGDSIFVKGGTYETGTTDFLVVDSNTVLEGAGNSTVFKLSDNRGNWKDIIRNEHFTGGTTDENIVIRGISFDGNIDNQDTSYWMYAIHFRNAKDSIIEKCYFYDWLRYGMYLGYTSTLKAERITVRNNFFENCADAVYLHYAYDCIVTENICQNFNHAYAAEPFYLYYSERNKILYNVVNLTKQAGLVLDHSKYNDIIGNTFQNTTTLSISFYSGDNEYNTVKDNRIINSQEYGIDISYGTFNTIEQNFVTTSYYSGISLRGGANNTVYRNTCMNNGQSGINPYGIYILNTNNNTITENHCTDNQTTKTQDNGIKETGTSDYNKIKRNNVAGNAFAGISVAGSNTKVQYNEGYVTENYVSSTNTTATTFVFNHGLAGTADFVFCSFNTTTISGWSWSSTSTQITVTVTGTGLPAIMACYCHCVYEP